MMANCNVDPKPEGKDWIIPDWPTPRNVRALITTRKGGVSVGPYEALNVGELVGDNPDIVAENRARIRLHLPGEPVWLRQVHGNKVIVADMAAGVPEADASVARKKGVALVVQTADCLPVLLCDVDGAVVGAAHAGWRGLSSGVIENTVQAMGVTGSRLLAFLGPAIGPDNFEVGSEVREIFVAQDGGAATHFRKKENGKWLADLYGLARRRLMALGVTRVFGGDFCTVADVDRFFSYRRDGITGRMATLIWLE
ncbi:MAG TPA: peptidoglycan editing factor PgeF [Burkholderiales bacterium]|nr:peptidoglycan editing factor PgeF [Burkholderiales bacterium]